MTADEFREMALAFPGTEERQHMGHPDFRVKGKIFATLNKDSTKGMVSITPEQQAEYIALDPAFHPAAGAWGAKGSTLITLVSAHPKVVHSALATAWQLRSEKR